MNVQQLGKLIISVGLSLVVLGFIVYFAPRIPFLNRLGRLPGDIRVQSKDGNFVFFAPIVSSILISLLLTLIVNILIRLFRK